MIFDRTKEDVETAEQIFNEKVKNFIPLSEEEESQMERGRLTTSTLNRIELKQAEIKYWLKELQYLKKDLINKQWNDGFFFKEDLQRLVENTKELRAAFYVSDNSTENPVAIFRYDEFNKIEKILFELAENIDNAKFSFKLCGTFNSNQSVLPLWRSL